MLRRKRRPGLASRPSCFLLHVQLLPLEEDLQKVEREQQEAQQRCRQLEKRVEELEERNASAVGERERQVQLLEARVSGGSHTSASLNLRLWLGWIAHVRSGWGGPASPLLPPGLPVAASYGAADRNLRRLCLFF